MNVRNNGHQISQSFAAASLAQMKFNKKVIVWNKLINTKLNQNDKNKHRWDGEEVEAT